MWISGEPLKQGCPRREVRNKSIGELRYYQEHVVLLGWIEKCAEDKKTKLLWVQGGECCWVLKVQKVLKQMDTTAQGQYFHRRNSVSFGNHSSYWEIGPCKKLSKAMLVVLQKIFFGISSTLRILWETTQIVVNTGPCSCFGFQVLVWVVGISGYLSKHGSCRVKTWSLHGS